MPNQVSEAERLASRPRYPQDNDLNSNLFYQCSHCQTILFAGNDCPCREESNSQRSLPLGEGSSLDEVKRFRKEMYDRSCAIIEQKGADYNRDKQKSGDTLFNLRVAELLGITGSIEEGILVRLSDKFMRLISLTKPGREAQVKDESVLDTIVDLHNYADYLGLEWSKRKARTKPCASVGSAPLKPNA